jgi:alpha-methylacyl-CoA racemase
LSLSGAIEPQFYAELLRGMDLNAKDLPDQNDVSRWPMLKKKFQDVFLQKTRDEWTAIFDGTDACVVPVLDMLEVNAGTDTHLGDRASIPHVQGTDGSKPTHYEPAAAPRLSRTPAIPPGKAPNPGQHTDEILKEWLGLDKSGIDGLIKTGKIGRSKL